MEGKKLLHKFYGEEEIKVSDMHLYFFFENEFTDYEDPLKVGDWITLTHRNIKIVGKIIEEKPTDYITDYDAGIGVNQWFDKDKIRKATAEEIAQEKRRRMFAKVGRKLNEFRDDDVVDFDGYRYFVSITGRGETICIYNLKKTIDINPSNVRPIYFVENMVSEEE